MAFCRARFRSISCEPCSPATRSSLSVRKPSASLGQHRWHPSQWKSEGEGKNLMPVCVRQAMDVVVVGAGTAGAIAGIAAARTGARTLLVDQYGQIGGMASTGMSFLGILDNEGYPALGGIGRELLSRLEQLGGGMPPRPDPALGSVAEVDPSLLRC